MSWGHQMIGPGAISKTHDSLQRCAVLIVAFHFLISLVHGVAHSRLQIEMKPWQTIYILIVITLLPLISGFFLWRAASKRRFLLLLASMLGALVFGGYYHFIAVGADNVASLGSHSWAPPFQVTAVLLAITEAAGVVAGFFGVLKK
jgi:hypothetical protein